MGEESKKKGIQIKGCVLFCCDEVSCGKLGLLTTHNPPASAIILDSEATMIRSHAFLQTYMILRVLIH